MNQKNNRIERLSLSIEEIAEHLRTLVDTKYDGNYVFELNKISDDEIDAIIDFGTGNSPVIMTLKQDDTGESTVFVNKNYGTYTNMLFAKDLREDLFALCKKEEPFQNNEVYEGVSSEDRSAICSFLDLHAEQTRNEINDQFSLSQYMGPDNRTLTINYYNSTHKLLVQTGSQTMHDLFLEALRTTTTIKTEKEKRDKEMPLLTSMAKDQITRSQMKSSLGKGLIEYLQSSNPNLLDTISSAFSHIRERKTMVSSDYSTMVEEITRCYESLIRTILYASGAPRYRTLANGRSIPTYPSDFFNRKGKQNEFRLKDDLFPTMTEVERIKLGRLYKAYSIYRNPSHHGAEANRHKTIKTYDEALKICNKIITSMRESYLILSKYLN